MTKLTALFVYDYRSLLDFCDQNQVAVPKATRIIKRVINIDKSFLWVVNLTPIPGNPGGSMFFYQGFLP
jgi:hypothetical protein